MSSVTPPPADQMIDRSPSFVHAADLHLGAPLQSLGGRLAGNPKERTERLRELRALASQAFTKLIDEVLTSEAAFVVLSGDIYDQAEREVASQLRFVDGLRRLREDGAVPVPVFVVHGNHDPIANTFRMAAEIPDHVTVFDPGDPQIRSVDVEGFGPVSIAGVSFASSAETENLVRRIANSSTDVGHPLIGVVHANVEGVSGHGPYAPCSVGDLEQSSVDYWALGHVHTRQVESLGPGRWWAYPGNLQGRSTKPAECGPKGLLRVPLEPSGMGVPQFVACDTIRFDRCVVDVTGAPDVDSVVQAVRESAIEAAKEAARDATKEAARDATDDASHDAAERPVLLAVELTGRSSVHSELMNQGDNLLAICRESLGGVLGLGEILRLRVGTLPEIDRDQLIGRGDLLSELLDRIDSIEAESDGDIATWMSDHLEQALDKRVAKLLTNDMESGAGWTEMSGPEGSAVSRELMARAERLLIDTLIADEDLK